MGYDELYRNSHEEGLVENSPGKTHQNPSELVRKQ